MNHPVYPLKSELHAAIIDAGPDATSRDINRIQREFAHRRDVEFPGWLPVYEAQVMAWIEWNCTGKEVQPVEARWVEAV